MNEEMAASTSRAMSSTQCATTPSLHALHNTPMKLLFVRVALGLGNSGEEQHGDAACRKEGSDCDGFEETHGWLLTLKLGLCGSVVGSGKGRLPSPLLE